MTAVEGSVEAGFELVRDAFALGQAHDEGAAQLAVYYQDQLVVDLWVGEDRRGGTRWDADSLVLLMSVAKGLMATVVHRLIQQGRLDVDAPVAQYWPEFAANGKDDVLVRHLLTHSAGLPGWSPEADISGAALLDWDRCTRALAAQAPLWKPGTAFDYHTLTFGYLIGEVVRRITSESPGTFFGHEIAEPLRLRAWIGLPESERIRVAPSFRDGPISTADAVLAEYASYGIDLADPPVVNRLATIGADLNVLSTPPGLAAEIPAANAVANARALARMYAAVIGEVDGVRLLTDEQVAIATTPQTDILRAPGELAKVADDFPLRFGLGYELSRRGNPMLGEGCFGHAGAGGRLGYADTVSGTAVGYTVTNATWDPRRGPDPRWITWTQALHAIVR
jgi:CubicO group peptidase (beta-lactamase class C family)